MKKLTSQQRPWIKVCGLTQVDNALAVAGVGPDAVGLVFFDKSPRNVSLKTAKNICTALPEGIDTIGVFVDESFDAIMKTVEYCHLTGVQLHGKESPSLVRQLARNNLLVIKALFARRCPYLTQSDEYEPVTGFLVEYGKGILPGGNAESWDYAEADALKSQMPLILAGGLDPDSVGKVVQEVSPAGIDVSSGVEQEPGIKDIKRTAAFITSARSAGALHS